MRETSPLNADQIAKKLRIVQNVYLTLTWMWGLTAIYGMFGLSKKNGVLMALQAILVAMTCFFAYYGLKTRKNWVLPLLLIAASFILVNSLANILTPASDLKALLYKSFHVIFVSFSVYQIHLLSKQEVRGFLGGGKDTIII